MGVVSTLIDIDPDLVLDLRDVSLRRDGTSLVGPLSWQVELDERWVVLGPNGAGKTSLLRIASALEYPSTGTAVILGEQLGRTEVTELRWLDAPPAVQFWFGPLGFGIEKVAIAVGIAQRTVWLPPSQVSATASIARMSSSVMTSAISTSGR